MIRKQFSLDLNHEIIADNFAGGGGASTGIELGLGRHVDLAFNHDPEACALHAANHPQTQHFCEDVFNVDIEKVTAGRPVGLAWFSPDCKHFSKAKGGKPKSKKIRGLAWVMVKWAATVRPRVMILENVEEFQDWGPLLPCGNPCPVRKGKTFANFIARLRNLGYRVEWKELRACDYAAPTIRKRLFLIARCDGKPIVWPEETHGAPKSLDVRRKRLKPWRTAAECIDFSRPCHSIFLTPEEARAVNVRRPLAPASNRRIAKGVERYVMLADDPFIVCLTHQGSDRVESIRDPFKTVTGAHRGERAVVVPSVTKFRTGSVGSDVKAPLPTVTAGPKEDPAGAAHALGLVNAKVAGAFLSENANASEQRNFDLEEPLRTQCAEVKGGHFSAVEASLAVPTIIQTGYGERAGQAPRVPGIEKPLGTAVAGAVKHAVVSALLAGMGGPSYSGKPKPVDAPFNSQTTENHSAVIATHVARQFGTAIGHATDKPSATCMTDGAGGKSQLVGTFLAQNNTGVVGHGTDEPVSTLTGTCSHQSLVACSMVKYYGTDQDPNLREPMHTATTKERFGLSAASVAVPPLTPEMAVKARKVAAFLREHGVHVPGEFATTKSGLVIWDIGMRMLEPRELYNAQGFPAEYRIDLEVNGRRLPKHAQVRMCGNSVCPPLAAALVRANVPELSMWEPGEQRRAA